MAFAGQAGEKFRRVALTSCGSWECSPESDKVSITISNVKLPRDESYHFDGLAVLPVECGW